MPPTLSAERSILLTLATLAIACPRVLRILPEMRHSWRVSIQWRRRKSTPIRQPV